MIKTALTVFAWILGAFLLVLSVTAQAAGVTGLRQHDHSSAIGGGSLGSGLNINGAIISGYTTLTGTLNNGLIQDARLVNASNTNTMSMAGGTDTGGANGGYLRVDGRDYSGAGQGGGILLRTWGGGKIEVAGPVNPSRTCAAGYTRLSPNECARNLSGSAVTIPFNTCTAIAAPASDAKAIDISLWASSKKSLRFFTAAGCPGGAAWTWDVLESISTTKIILPTIGATLYVEYTAIATDMTLNIGSYND